MSTHEFFDVSLEKGIARLTMRLPPLNILDRPMMTEMNAILAEVLSEADLVAVVISGAGKAFSAGVDVGDHAAETVASMLDLFHGIFRKLATTDALTIAAVNGAALGGGCELACFCDIVLASDRAKFGQPEVRVGVFPPVAAIVLPAQIGLRKAIELNALGSTIRAEEAHRLGLVNQVFPADSFDEHVEQYLDEIRSLSRPVVRLTKRITAHGTREAFLERLEQAERVYLDELMSLSDAHEGIAAFIEKRSPEWSHA